MKENLSNTPRIEQSQYYNCATAAFSGIVPGDPLDYPDLLASAFYNDGNVATLARIIGIGLFRRGILPEILQIEDDRSIADLIQEVDRDSPNFGRSFMGAVVHTNSLECNQEGLNALRSAIQERKRLAEVGHLAGTVVSTHAVAVTRIFPTRRGTYAHVIDTTRGTSKIHRTPLHRLDSVAITAEGARRLSSIRAAIFCGVPIKDVGTPRAVINASDLEYRQRVFEKESETLRRQSGMYSYDYEDESSISK